MFIGSTNDTKNNDIWHINKILDKKNQQSGPRNRELLCWVSSMLGVLYAEFSQICPLFWVSLLYMLFNRTVALQNKSILLPKIIFTNTQTLLLLTINVKAEIDYRVLKMSRFGFRYLESWNLKGCSAKFENKNEVFLNKIRECSVQVNISNQSKPLHKSCFAEWSVVMLSVIMLGVMPPNQPSDGFLSILIEVK